MVTSPNRIKMLIMLCRDYVALHPCKAEDCQSLNCEVRGRLLVVADKLEKEMLRDEEYSHASV